MNRRRMRLLAESHGQGRAVTKSRRLRGLLARSLTEAHRVLLARSLTEAHRVLLARLLTEAHRVLLAHWTRA
jgi:hypothetical protein